MLAWRRARNSPPVFPFFHVLKEQIMAFMQAMRGAMGLGGGSARPQMQPKQPMQQNQMRPMQQGAGMAAQGMMGQRPQQNMLQQRGGPAFSGAGPRVPAQGIGPRFGQPQINPIQKVQPQKTWEGPWSGPNASGWDDIMAKLRGPDNKQLMGQQREVDPGLKAMPEMTPMQEPSRETPPQQFGGWQNPQQQQMMNAMQQQRQQMFNAQQGNQMGVGPQNMALQNMMQQYMTPLATSRPRPYGGFASQDEQGNVAY